jgi:hypothetical protein
MEKVKIYNLSEHLDKKYGIIGTPVRTAFLENNEFYSKLSKKQNLLLENMFDNFFEVNSLCGQVLMEVLRLYQVENKEDLILHSNILFNSLPVIQEKIPTIKIGEKFFETGTAKIKIKGKNINIIGFKLIKK